MGRVLRTPEDLVIENMQYMGEDLYILNIYKQEEAYYCFFPKKYFVRRLGRFFLIFGVISLLAHPLLIAPLGPWFVHNIYKYHVFTKHLSTINVSSKKMWFILIFWIIVTMILGVILRDLLIQLL